MAGALLLFIIPVNLRRGDFVMNWEATKELPWGVLLLFGGGLSAWPVTSSGMAWRPISATSRWVSETCR